ncbi:MAG: 5-carboxymethyl-2-hydroxymuconate Delta-isomerase [Formosimonas sp.]
MPHLTVEYSANLALDAQAVLLRLNQTLLDSGEFDELDIKSRMLRLDDFRVGLNAPQEAFVHVKLAILSGRSAAVKQRLSAQLLHGLQTAQAWPSALSVQLCVEINEIERDSYSKTHMPKQ